MVDYLAKLPPAARERGSAERGEIEILDPGSEAPGERFGVVYEDDYIQVVRDLVRFPGGNVSAYIRILERSAGSGPSGAVVVPLRNGRVVMRRVFRHATRSWEVECPRGFRNAGESVEDTMRREVAEEIGVDISDAVRLGEVCANTGLFGGIAIAFLARLTDDAPAPSPESTEAFGDVFDYSPEELRTVIADGGIRDGFTLSALTLARARGLLDF